MTINISKIPFWNYVLRLLSQKKLEASRRIEDKLMLLLLRPMQTLLLKSSHLLKRHDIFFKRLKEVGQ